MTLAKAVEEELKRQGISKGDFLTFRGKKLLEINKWGEKQSLFTPRILVTRTGLEPKTQAVKPA